jgi:phospholipase/lecithinase/hemolysin
MRSIRRVAVGAVASLCLAVSPLAARASTFYVFGDSLSDVGNVFVATGGAEPASPYFNGQFSNGPIWAQDLSNSLGFGPLNPSLLGGTDYAFGGATTSNPATESTLVPTLTQQVGMFLASVGGSAPSSALYSVWIGSNDLLDILGSGTTGPGALAEAQAAAQSEATDIGTLITHGARDILVPLVPDLGVSPAATSIGAGPAATVLSQTYDAALVADVGGLGSVAGLDVTYLDTLKLIDAVVSDPSAFGLTNVTAPCYVGPITGGGSVCVDPNEFLFWDTEHPTAVAHAQLAAAAATALLPEPGTIGVLAAGLTVLAFMHRRRQRD